MQNPLAAKLELFAPLSGEDERILNEIGSSSERFAEGDDIITEGEVPRSVFVILDGFACRYRILPDGRRQILTFLMPGDLCDLHVFLLKRMDHSIGALVPTRLAAIPTATIMEMVFRHPRISAALWWSSLQEEAILRERIVALGRRDAAGRLAYLLCELFWRFQAIGATAKGSYEFPLTQDELADTLGLTPAHVNRVLQRLRRQELIAYGRRTITILAPDELQAVAGFDRRYLHLGGAPRGMRDYFDRLERQPRRA